METDEQKPLQDVINYYYEQFVNIVTQNRPNLSKEQLIHDFGANVYPASQAKEYGYMMKVQNLLEMH